MTSACAAGWYLYWVLAVYAHRVLARYEWIVVNQRVTAIGRGDERGNGGIVERKCQTQAELGIPATFRNRNSDRNVGIGTLTAPGLR